MALTEITVINEEEQRRQVREKFIKTRLMHVYQFAQQFLGPYHLDIGTYDGFALSTLAEKAQHITTFDINDAILQKAMQRPDVTELMESNRLKLLQMDARQIGLPANTYDSATLIEVLGGAFEGDRRDIDEMFREAYRVLKPGAPLIFTIKSQSSEETLQKYFDWHIPKGYPQYRREMAELLTENGFDQVDWYGHVFMTLTENGNPIMPLRITRNGRTHLSDLDEKLFIPKPACEFEKEDQTELPLYWVGVCQKPTVDLNY